ncbi:hypothetical protein QFC22_003661 [Naganishia vaughanmartiniae]|uniref:Uncharacterized protein n=1 Tax=Naganishia vaughanmartiniae TaxID=1424756 RepID=A0ACC2X572_9TREE|nr:hypothetical protein QFC22_003661 [Naganishia vaughanmartiniae]
MFLSKLSNKRYSLAFLGLMSLVLTANYMNTSCFFRTASCKSRKAAYNTLLNTNGHHKSGETIVVAHAPGFTLFENAYWRNHTWYFVSSRPWAFPEMSTIMTNAPGYDEWPPLFHDGLAKLVSLAEAEALRLNLQSVEIVKGSTFIFNDKTFLDHFYHLVGEMFLGAWRVYTSVLVNVFDNSSQRTMHANDKSLMDQVPPVDRFIFNHAPPNNVFDHAQLNQYFFDKIFPRSTLEFADEWQARADSLKLYRFDRVMIADRWSGHGNTSPKPMERAFKLPVPSNWVSDLKKRMLADYKGPVSLKDPSHAKSKPVITYLSRQEAVFRTLSDEAHEALSVGLKTLEQEGLAEVNVETFTDADPKDEQVAKISRTTVSNG